jgi:hypothetical protein
MVSAVDVYSGVETAMNQVLQSGSVTPQHLASWTTDGVIQDSGVTFNNTLGLFRSDVLGINFNATNADTPIPVNLPVGYTKWQLNAVFLSGASGTLTTATCSLWTQAGGNGVAIISSGTAITVNTNLSDTNNNMQFFTPNNINTLAYVDTTIYFRVQNPQGNAATGNVSIFYRPMP